MSENTSRVGAVLSMVSDLVRRMANLLSDGHKLVAVLKSITDSVSCEISDYDSEVSKLDSYRTWIISHQAFIDSVSELRDKFLEKHNEFYELEQEDWGLDSFDLEKDERKELKQALDCLFCEVVDIAQRVNGELDLLPRIRSSYSVLCSSYGVKEVKDEVFNA